MRRKRKRSYPRPTVATGYMLALLEGKMEAEGPMTRPEMGDALGGVNPGVIWGVVRYAEHKGYMAETDEVGENGATVIVLVRKRGYGTDERWRRGGP